MNNKVVTTFYLFKDTPGWSNESYIKPSKDTYKGFVKIISIYQQEYNPETNSCKLDKNLNRRTDLTINWYSYKQGKLTIPLSQTGFLPKYLVVVQERLNSQNKLEKVSDYKHYFLEPIHTKNKSKDYITYEVIPDIWVEEVLVKDLSIIAKRQLTNNTDDVFKNEDIVKDNLLYESPGKYKQEPLFNPVTIPKYCRHIGAPGAFSVLASNYVNHSLPQINYHNYFRKYLEMYGGWYTVGFLLGERNIKNIVAGDFIDTDKYSQFPTTINTLNRLVENPFTHRRLNGVDANWYIIDYKPDSIRPMIVEPTQGFRPPYINEKLDYADKVHKFFGVSGSTMSSFYENGEIQQEWQKNYFLSSGQTGSVSANWMNIEKDKIDQYYNKWSRQWWPKQDMHFGFVWTQNNASTTLGNDLVAKYFYKPEFITKQYSYLKVWSKQPDCEDVSMPSFTKNISFNFYNSYDMHGNFNWESPFEELRLGITKITSQEPPATENVDLADVIGEDEPTEVYYAGNRIGAPIHTSEFWIDIWTKLPFKFSNLRKDKDTDNDYILKLEPGQSIKSDFWWIMNYNGKIYYAIRLNPTYLVNGTKVPPQFENFNPIINNFEIKVDALNGYSLLVKNGKEIKLDYGNNLIKTTYINKVKTNTDDISNGWVNGAQLIVEVTNRYGTKTYFEEFNKDIAGSDLEKQLQFLQIQNESRNIQDRLTFQKYERDKGIANAAISTITGAGMIGLGSVMGIGEQPQYAPAILSGMQNMTNGINNLIYGSVTRSLQHQIEQRDAANAKQKLFLQMQQLNLNTANLDMWTAKLLFINDPIDYGFIILHYTPTRPSLELYYNLANNYGVEYNVTADIGIFNPALPGVHQYQFIKNFDTYYWDELTTMLTAPYRVK